MERERKKRGKREEERRKRGKNREKRVCPYFGKNLKLVNEDLYIISINQSVDQISKRTHLFQTGEGERS